MHSTKISVKNVKKEGERKFRGKIFSRGDHAQDQAGREGGVGGVNFL